MDRAVRTFDIGHCLGRGGFGEVYKATLRTQGGLESVVALKVLRRDLDPRGQAVQRLRDEGRLLAKLDHPSILRVHDLAVLEGRVALVCEYIAGEDLETLMRGRDKLGPRALLEVVAKVAHALHAAWSAPLRDGTPLRLVHRDIKPSNIRIGKHGEVKLLDFGIARTDAIDREARTQTDMLVGSPAYMAPERFKTNNLDPASDVFALGATLLEGLTGRRFYGRMEMARIAGLGLDAEAFAEHLQTQLGHLPRNVPDPIQDLVSHALRPDPAQRLTAEQLADRAERLADEVGGDSLARVARARTWRPESDELAELSGKTVSEGTFSAPGIATRPELPPEHDPRPLVQSGPVPETAPVARSTAPPVHSLPPVDAAPTGPRWGLMAFLGMLVIGAGLLGLFSAAGLGGLAWSWQNGFIRPDPVQTEPPAPEQPAPAAPADPPDEAGDGVVDAPAPGPAPVPEPAPAQPNPSPPSPAPSPSPVEPRPPAAPAPEPTPTPAPDADEPGRVKLSGANITGVAIGEPGTVDLPADLPPGFWKVEVRKQGALIYFESIPVESGSVWVVNCAGRMNTCKAEQER